MFQLKPIVYQQLVHIFYSNAVCIQNETQCGIITIRSYLLGQYINIDPETIAFRFGLDDDGSYNETENMEYPYVPNSSVSTLRSHHDRFLHLMISWWFRPSGGSNLFIKLGLDVSLDNPISLQNQINLTSLKKADWKQDEETGFWVFRLGKQTPGASSSRAAPSSSRAPPPPPAPAADDDSKFQQLMQDINDHVPDDEPAPEPARQEDQMSPYFRSFLESFDLRYGLRVLQTDKSLEAMGFHCKSLETLSLDSTFISNEGVLAIAQGCPLLKVLKIQCINVTDRALMVVEGSSFYGKGCKKLNNLTLSDCNFLDDRGLEAIATGCTELTHLEVNGCHNIGTTGLESVGKSCIGLVISPLLKLEGCKYLQALHLVDCYSLGDEAICLIARGCRNLKKLHIRICYEVGSNEIIVVGENCHSLTDLSLCFCDRVQDEALIAIGQGCPLQYLNVSGCNQIGDVGIVAIARGCPALAYLDNLGDMALAELGRMLSLTHGYSTIPLPSNNRHWPFPSGQKLPNAQVMPHGVLLQHNWRRSCHCGF
ncbi:F-box/LRR-repeat protein 4 [Hibiscus syriacus]|uniref:F-box/LRR-repeat protein 4 n=1 Tax=Hibiscus syriacus TaxID=106335 RepID=A0A6A2ZY37_HIBSY|nr:F-box/LRR-repeat protein 4 [Hibiscus syriacus]